MVRHYPTNPCNLLVPLLMSIHEPHLVTLYFERLSGLVHLERKCYRQRLCYKQCKNKLTLSGQRKVYNTNHEKTGQRNKPYKFVSQECNRVLKSLFGFRKLCKAHERATVLDAQVFVEMQSSRQLLDSVSFISC